MIDDDVVTVLSVETELDELKNKEDMEHKIDK